MAQLKAAEQLIKRYRPRKVPGRRFLRRSAVCLIVREEASVGLSVLMIKRAEKKGDPWSGHMAFPGGRMDREDDTILTAALRELHEEVGIDGKSHCQYLGRLSDLVTKAHVLPRPMVVTPFIFKAEMQLPFTLNEEVDEVIWIPLRFLANLLNREEMTWKVAGVSVQLPCYFYRGRRVWGLSLAMLDELLKLLDSQLALFNT